jgi:hypothetical protein
VSMTRANSCHYCPGGFIALWLTVGMLVLLFVGACRQGVPVMDRRAPSEATDAITAPRSTPAPAVAPTRASRPRGPAYRVDNGLGSPIARLRQRYGEASSV